MAISSPSKQVQVVTPTPDGGSDVAVYNKAPPSTGEAFGTIAQLPLAIQAAFQQKLLAILALQLFVVGVTVGVFEWEGSVKKHIQADILDSTMMIGLVVVLVVGLLALLHCIRNKFPLNWIVLGLFSGAQVLGLLCLDAALDSSIIVVNCGFTWVAIVLIMGLTRWTKPATSTSEAALRSPFLIGFIGLVGASVVVAVIDVVVGGIFRDSDEIMLSALVQLCVMAWFCHEIKALHKKLSPDEYMRGVVYFYTDLLVVSAVIFACAVGGGEAALLAQPIGGSGTTATGEDEV